MRTKLLLMLIGVLGTINMTAQIMVSGKITDDLGESLIGANILEENTANGAISDFDGNFEFEVQNIPTRLVVSYLGYTTQYLDIDGTTTFFDIVLESGGNDMEEVLVIGSSITQERKKLGNAVTSLKSEALVKATPQNITNAIQGKIPGAQITQNSGDPAGGFSIRLRGPSTIKGSSEPLYVVDGVVVSNLTTNVTNLNVAAGDASPGQNRMVDFNPNDITNISVLNGAAAAAIYGSRASNGVVVVTTKKGSLSDGPEFYFKTSANYNRLRKKLDLNLRGEQFESGLGERLWPIFGRDPVTGNNTPFQNLLTNKFEVTRYDYQDLIFDDAFGTDNYFSARGGSGKFNYFGSLGYTSNGGIIKNTQFNRFTAKGKINHFVNDWISYELGLNITNSASDEKPDGNVFWSPVNSVNITNNIYNPNRLADGQLPSVEPTRVNPLSVIDDFDITQDVMRVVPHLRLSLEPIQGLKIDQILGMDSYTQDGSIIIPSYDYAPVNGAYFDRGYRGTAEAKVFNWNYDINAIYTTDLTDDIVSTTTAGYNFQASELELSGSQGRDLDASGNPEVPLEFFPQDQRLDIYGFFLQQSFDLYDKYFITLAGRVDGATNFDPDERNNFYPKVSASYLLSNEDFWNVDFIDVARVRTSYGEAGNLTAIAPFERFSSFQPFDFLGQTGLAQNSRLGNLGLKPERTKEFEIGTDLTMFNKRLNLLFTYYQQNISDLLVERLVSPSVGGVTRTENVGSMKNNGLEFYASYALVQSDKLKWNVNLNYSRNRNEVEATNAGPVSIATVSGAIAQVREGEPLGVFFGTYYDRNSDGSIVLDAEGRPVGATDESGQLLRRVIGDPNPDYLLALGTDLSYGRFDFSMLWESVQGFDVFDADYRTRQGVGIGKFAEQELTGELPRGWIAAIYPIEEYRVVDGSFIKLREISLGYSIPKIGNAFSNFRLSLEGRNLLSIDDFPSYDPETNAGGQSNLLRAVNFGNVPIPQTFTLALSTNF